MQYRTLGKTGLKVSVVGFGGIPIQRINGQQAGEVIWKAEEAGINFIDTARGYTISETYIGEALKGRRDRWILASKSMARDQESMEKDIETSLKNMQTEYIDLYQFHNIRTREEYDKVFGETGAYRAMEKAKEQGKIGYIGVTSHSVDSLAFLIENAPVDTIMCPYNIVERQAEDLIKRAAELGIGVIAMKPLAGGALEDSTLAMKFIQQNEHIATAIPGMGSICEVEQNASTVNQSAQLSPEEREKILQITAELGDKFCRRCGYCAPCPQGIDIPTMFLLQGYYRRYDLAKWAQDRYEGCQKHAGDCADCGRCEPKCPYGLSIREMLQEVKKDFGR